MPQPIAEQLQSIPMSSNLSQSFGRAQEFAREQAHRSLLLEHLLLALTEDPEASGVLRACNVDTVRLSTDVSGYLGRLLDDMRAEPGTEPSPDNELLRVIEAARQAAQQSRRRSIDGAIVLAAIVGDGKSPAAGLLKAHGMTFDEAIRTLQKASAQARSKQYAAASPNGTAASPVAERPVTSPASPPVGQEPSPPREPPPREPQPAAHEPPAAPSPAPQQASAGQSVDDILAAARARIQQRTGITIPPRPEPPPQAPPPPEQPPQAAAPDLPLLNLSNYAPATAPSSPDLPDLPPRMVRPASALGLSPTPPGASPAPPLPGGAPQPPVEPSLSIPRAFHRPSDETARTSPPPPLRLDRPLRSDWGDEPTQSPGRSAGPPHPGVRRPAAEPGRPQQARTPRPGQRAAAGPLIETIPRRMRVGSGAPAQVRIGRDKIDTLIQLLAAGRALPHPEGVIGHMLSVRLTAADGGFAIDAETPEQQWVEVPHHGQPHSQLADDYLGWRWTVTPLRRGRRRLQLIVTARALTRDGIGPEMAPPDRTIEVVVRRNRLRGLVRFVSIGLLLGLGIAIGKISQDKLAQDLIDVVTGLWRNAVGLLVTSGFLSG